MPREERDTVLCGRDGSGPEDEEDSLDPEPEEDEDEDQEIIDEEFDIFVEDELDEIKQDDIEGDEDVRLGDFLDNDDDFWEETDADEDMDEGDVDET